MSPLKILTSLIFWYQIYYIYSEEEYFTVAVLQLNIYFQYIFLSAQFHFFHFHKDIWFRGELAFSANG